MSSYRLPTLVQFQSRAAVRTEADVAAPIVLEPERLATAHTEHDQPLQFEGSTLPAGLEHDLTIVRGELDQDGWYQGPDGYASKIHDVTER
jgi:hypothetical protein